MRACSKTVDFEVRNHATNNRDHLVRLVDFEPVPNALTVDEAEKLLEPRKTESRKRRRDRYQRESRRGQEEPSPSLAAVHAGL